MPIVLSAASIRIILDLLREHLEEAEEKIKTSGTIDYWAARRNRCREALRELEEQA